MKKNTLHLTLSLALTLSAAQAPAGWGFDKKYSNYPDADDVQRVSLKLGAQGTLLVTGVSYNGKFRLESISGQATNVFTVSGAKIKRLGLDNFLLDCEKNRNLEIFDLAHEKENVYTLEGEVLPLNRSNVQALTGGLIDETIYTEVKTGTPLDDSLMGPHAKSANLTARAMRRWLDPQIEEQKSSIWETGRIKIDLTGKDAFVCDLLTKKTTLVMGTLLGFAKAMPVSTPAITPQELRSVVEKMENRTLPARSVRDGIAVNAILQNEAIKEVLNKDISSFDVSNFLKIANALVDGNTGNMKVKSSDSLQVKRIARSLDTVEYLKQNNNVMVYPDVEVK